MSETAAREEAMANEREALLARLLSDLADALARGEQPDVDAAAAAHPEVAQELRELWGMASVAHHLADSSPGSGPLDATLAWRAHVDEAALATLPRRFGDYELLAELGRGGMGIVYRARQLSLNRVVALKMMLQGALASPADQARFRAEAEAAARLDHPHIVPVYDVGEHQGQHFFTMRLIEGMTLARRLDEGPLTAAEAAAILAPVARAVAYAHARGVLHRDLKPSNILIDAEGRPHVSDFGLAKQIAALSDLTRSGAIMGTPSYMAPEQAAGSRGQLGPATDVYSLGTILYETLTGRPVFQAASPVDTVLMVLEQDPLPPRLLNPKADRELEMVALRCLQKPSELRYPTADELADDLERYQRGEPVAARSGGLGLVVARWFRETHHAAVLENWGLLWMWHSLVIFGLGVLADGLGWMGVTSYTPYLALWTFGLAVWVPIFWALRRRAGPVTFVERQIAHVWASGVVGSILLFIVEIILRLPVTTLCPALAVISGMVFVVKAGILSGVFYFQAAALFATALAMAVLQTDPIGQWHIPGTSLTLLDFRLTLYGAVAALCFFLPGLKYYLQRREATEDVAGR